MAEEYYVGLMSGTSVDAVDAVLIAVGEGALNPRLVAALGTPMPADLRASIFALCEPGTNEIDRLGDVDVRVGRLFADAAHAVIEQSGVSQRHIRAIGSHGQTVRHRPGAATPFTLQIGDPNTIAERTGITTVADFRRRDISVGGQGAPLVPAFHDAVFRSEREDRVVLNVGGMSNLTVLPSDRTLPIRGFDTGPGNALLDGWHLKHRGEAFDRGGRWAASGTVDAALLSDLLTETWLEQAPPKSTGRELFSLPVLESRHASRLATLPAVDVQATLAELTARTVTGAIQRWGTSSGSVFVCGGGAHNTDLCRRFGRLLPSHRIASTAELGIDPDWVEAMAFAWLAARTLAGLPGNVPAVTGAGAAVVLGGIYPGRNGI